MDVAERIRRRLKATGLKMGQASRMAKLSHTYVRDVVQGRVKNPRSEHLGRLARVLGTTLEWLSEGRGDEAPSPAQLEYDGLESMVRRIAPEDIPQAVRALRGFVRDDGDEAFDHKPVKAPAKKKRRRD